MSYFDYLMRLIVILNEANTMESFGNIDEEIPDLKKVLGR